MALLAGFGSLFNGLFGSTYGDVSVHAKMAKKIKKR
jgi:hypothetical protein